MTANQAASVVGQLARDMARGYDTHIAAIRLAPRLNAHAFVGEILDYPIDAVKRKDGTDWSFDTRDALLSLADKAIAAELPHVWLAGSLITLGDALERNNYFDRAPVLELIRHLRNGIAHGNRFSVRQPDKLKQFPANNCDASFKKTIFEITPALDEKLVLFNFMEPGDVLDLLYSVGRYLKQIGERQHHTR
jgi:hypothetical protein